MAGFKQAKEVCATLRGAWESPFIIEALQALPQDQQNSPYLLHLTIADDLPKISAHSATFRKTHAPGEGLLPWGSAVHLLCRTFGWTG